MSRSRRTPQIIVPGQWAEGDFRTALPVATDLRQAAAEKVAVVRSAEELRREQKQRGGRKGNFRWVGRSHLLDVLALKQAGVEEHRDRDQILRQTGDIPKDA